MRALLIDDSRATRSFLRMMLSKLGFETAEAANGRLGLEELQKGWPFDLALVDWNMPEMDGYEFLRAVRADRTFDAMKIIMVTSETEATRVVAAMETGADEYIMKPFTQEILADKIDMVGLGAS